MARYTCPSCGAPYNGKRCRACNYAHFSEEIAHGSHSHRGEPLVLKGHRRPIPAKDPFGCEKKTRTKTFPRREKQQRPFAGLFAIFLLIYALLPMVRNWGLELEAREQAMQMELVRPQNSVVIHEEGPITFRLEGRQIRQPQISGGVTLIDEDGIFLQSLGHWSVNGDPRYEHGQIKFFLENHTDHLLSMQSLDVTVGGEAVSLYFWAEVPAGAKALVGLDLWALEKLEFSTPTELGELEMQLEFLDMDTGSVKIYPVTMPMVSQVPVVIE